MDDKVRRCRDLWEVLRDMWVIVLDHFRNAESGKTFHLVSEKFGVAVGAIHLTCSHLFCSL